jgi:hypothetical protein
MLIFWSVLHSEQQELVVQPGIRTKIIKPAIYKRVDLMRLVSVLEVPFVMGAANYIEQILCS